MSKILILTNNKITRVGGLTTFFCAVVQFKRKGDTVMNESVLVKIILIVTLIPIFFSFLFVCFIPKLRYLPTLLVFIIGLCFLLSTQGNEPTGGGPLFTGGNLGKFFAIAGGVMFIISSGIVFFISFLMHKSWKSRKDTTEHRKL